QVWSPLQAMRCSPSPLPHGAYYACDVISSYVAIGDSFTEGVGDELPDGSVRGWADRVASGLAAQADGDFAYANLAVRGRKLGPIVREQLDEAIAMRPDLLSINGGGNDLMR